MVDLACSKDALMKKIYALSKITFSLSLLATLMGCAHSSSAPVYGVQSEAVPQSACANNAYLKQYGCSLERVEQAAQTNEPDAEYALGYMYYNGIGTVKDPETAIVWIKRAAQQGQPLAIDALKTLRESQFPTMGKITVNGQQSSQHVTTSHAVSAKPVQKAVATKSPSAQKPLDNMGKLANMPGDHFTVQLFASPHLNNVRHLELSLPHSVPMTIASMQKNGSTWYLLLAGNFANRQQAMAYVSQLPNDIKASKPWVRSFASLNNH